MGFGLPYKIGRDFGRWEKFRFCARNGEEIGNERFDDEGLKGFGVGLGWSVVGVLGKVKLG